MPHFVSEVKKSGSRETLSQLPLFHNRFTDIQ